MRRLGRGHRIVVAVAAVVAILVAATGAAWPAVLGAVGGAGLGLLLARWALGAPARAISRPLDCEYTLDLLRRAHGGRAAWAIGLRVGDAEVRAHEDAALDDAAMEQGVGLVRLASVDGRAHVAPQPDGTLVAVGDFPYAAGVLLPRPDVPAGVVDDVTTDLRRLVAAMRIVELEVADEDGQLVARRLALHASGTQTLGGVARAGAELAQELSQRAAAIVVQDADGRELRVAGISSAADRRLLHAVLSPAAAVWRAVEVGLPVVTQGDEDVFGPGVPERRRKERAGTAYPLADGHTAVGALVVLGPPAPPTGRSPRGSRASSGSWDRASRPRGRCTRRSAVRSRTRSPASPTAASSSGCSVGSATRRERGRPRSRRWCTSTSTTSSDSMTRWGTRRATRRCAM